MRGRSSTRRLRSPARCASSVSRRARRARPRRRRGGAAPITSATPASSAGSTVDAGRGCGTTSRRSSSSSPSTTSTGARPAEAAERVGRLPWWRACRTPRGRRRRASRDRACIDSAARSARAARLAVDLDGVAARLGPEGDAAAGACGERIGPDAGAAGALLAPGLGAGHRDLAAGLASRRCRGGVRSSSARTASWTSALVEGLAEDGLVEGRACPGACRARRRGGLRRRCASPRSEPSRAGHGAAHAAAGCARCRTSTTSRPRWVDALVAHLAGAADALEHARGVAEAPIEPGARTLCEPCETGPRWKLWRLIVPWKPLPFETPATLTVCALLERRRPSPRRPSRARPRRRGTPPGGAAARAPAFLQVAAARLP